MRDLTCPVCQADIPLSGDEKPGDEIFCTYCGAPCRIAGHAGEEGNVELEAEEDF